MTDPTLPDDELVSAYLDGEVTADERARVEGDPILMARAETLARARDLLRRPVEQPSPVEVDRAVAAALASPAPAPVTVRRLRQRRLAPAWLSVAALVVALLVAVPLLADLGRDGGDDQDETTALGDEEADTSGAGQGGEAGGSADMTLEAAAPGVVDLGAIDDEAALREAIAPALAARAVQPEAAADAATQAAGGDEREDEGAEDGEAFGGGAASTTSAPAAPDAQRCRPAELGPPLLEATAVYAGTEAVVLAYDAPEGTRVLVLAVDSCGVIADVTL